MHVIEALNNSRKPLISLEITPPNKGQGIEEIFETLDNLMPYEPSFINVTYHQPQVTYEEIGGTIYRIPKRKKAGTVGICASITNRYNIETVPHFICGGFNKFETEDALIDLHYLGITNLLALRGDPPFGHTAFIPEKDGHQYASSLVKQIANMNRGIYLEDLEDAKPTNFCIGVAGYPEKHFEAPSFEKDLQNLKYKVDQGAHYIITQMFYNFDAYKKFVERAREIGITVPIIPGIKPITRLSQLSSLPRFFYISIPHSWVEALEDARTPEKVFQVGIKKMIELCEKLVDFKVPAIHIYTMGKGKGTQGLLEGLLK